MPRPPIPINRPRQVPARLRRAVSALGLPEDVKAKLLATNLVRDSGPPANCISPNDALAEGFLQRSYANETDLDKYTRALIWNMIYFPDQFVAFHTLLSWASGFNYTPDSDEVVGFRRNKGKYIKAAIKALDLRNVRPITQKETADGRTCAGVRLSVSGNDYNRVVVKAADRKNRKGLANLQDAVSDEATLPEDVADPVLRESLVVAKERFRLLAADSMLKGLLESPENDDQGRGEDEDEDED